MRTAQVSIAIALLLTGSAAASSASNPLQHGLSQGVRVDVYAPGRVVFDLTHANATVRGMLRGPQIAPGCVKARLVNGLWRAIDVATTSPLRRRFEVDLAPTPAPPGAVGASLRVPYDGCEIGGLYGHRWNDAWGTRDAVEVWLTVRGRHFFNDRAAARDLAYFVRSGRVQKIRTSATPRPGLERFVKRYPRRVVEMARSSGRVPKHVIGFWIGRGTIVFTTTSPTGRRLFVVAKRGTLRLPSKNLGDLAFVF
jgi:hypothetical protein